MWRQAAIRMLVSAKGKREVPRKRESNECTWTDPNVLDRKDENRTNAAETRMSTNDNGTRYEYTEKKSV